MKELENPVFWRRGAVFEGDGRPKFSGRFFRGVVRGLVVFAARGGSVDRDGGQRWAMGSSHRRTHGWYVAREQ